MKSAALDEPYEPPPGLVEAVVAAVRERGGRGGTEIGFRCPAHEDRKPSATFNRREAVWKCHGCGASGGVEDLAHRLGIDPGAFRPIRPATVTPIRTAKAKAGGTWTPSTEPPADLRHHELGKPSHAWPVRDPGGRLFALHVRFDGPKDKTFRWWRNAAWTLDGLGSSDAPLYGTDRLAGADRVVLVEGEKAADALAACGVPVVATVTGASSTPGPEALAVLRDRDVILWPDADKTGRAHMERISAALAGVARSVRTFDPGGESGADAVEWLADRGELDAAGAWTAIEADAVAVGPPPRVRYYTGAELEALDLPDLQPVIEGLAYEGAATIVSGKPKVGKSALARNLAVAVAKGTPVLGCRVTPGRVLYISMEDGRRRMRKRFRDLIGARWPDRLVVADLWPRAGEGGVEEIDRFLDEHRDTRLVIVDTLFAFRGAAKLNEKLTDYDYRTINDLHTLAERRSVAVVIVAHNRKREADDFLDEVSGSAGVTAAADAVAVLRRSRTEADAELEITGRDIEERKLALTFDGTTGEWSLAEGGRAALLSPERREILDYLRTLNGEAAWPREIAQGIDRPDRLGSIKHLLGKLCEEGLVERGRRGYMVAGSTLRL